MDRDREGERMVKGEINAFYYRSIGQGMMNDVLSVDFEVNGINCIHHIPNKGWAYENPSLQFLGYLEIRPTDIERTRYIPEDIVMCPVVKNQNEYFLSKKAFDVGKYFLKESEWFDPSGTIWDSGENKAFGGMNVEPGTGNRAAVDEDQ